MAVVVAAVANMILGSLWYGPFFGKQWMELSGISMEKMKGKAPNMGKTYALAFLGSLLMAYVLAHALVFASEYMSVSGVSAGVMTGFWNWLGFVAPVTLGAVLWEGKSWKLWGLMNGYYVITLMLMGIILSVWA